MKRIIAPLVLVGMAGIARAEGDGLDMALSEKDFMSDMPIVLSVSRLAQRLDETPGAMTIIDRDFIRASGARDVVDVLRFVPGFQTTTSFETDAPMASYHGRIDDFANRIQVMVDGRSVYSGYLQGSAGVGWQTLALEDIERIEVLRGSNSASYGARALLGVVNIVSRDVRDTLGGQAWLRGGENGVADVGGSVGWGDTTQLYRLTVDSRGDEGLRKRFFSPERLTKGNNRVDRVNFSSQYSGAWGGELALRAGAMEIAAKRGTPDDAAHNEAGNVDRRRFLGTQYLQADWTRALSTNEDLALSFSRTQGFSNDAFPYNKPSDGPYNGIEISFSAREVNDVLGVQYTQRHSPSLRSVSGAEWRSEWLQSKSSFDTRGEVYSHYTRLYSNAEWRFAPQWLLNVGALWENSDIADQSLAPRAMVNWQWMQGHTMRLGVSSAFRTPSAFEKYGEVTYYDKTGANPLPYLRASGNVVSEKVISREWGYLLQPVSSALNADVRVFHEHIVNGIGRVLPSPGPEGKFGNGDNYEIYGAEWQWQWRPSSSSRLFWTQSWTNVRVISQAFPADGDAANFQFKTEHGAPAYSHSLVWSQELGQGYTLALMHWTARDVALGGDSENVYSMTRNDVRFAREVQWGRNKMEIALTLQNINAPYQDLSKNFWFDQRAWCSLRWSF